MKNLGAVSSFLLVLTSLLATTSICFATNPRYQIEGTEQEPIVTDFVTGLQWQQDTSLDGGGVAWKDALAHCEALSYGGHDNWRLPDVTELMSIVDEKSEDPPAINRVFFPDFNSGSGHWTSTTSRKNGNLAYVVYFGEQDSSLGRGGLGTINKTSAALALCVRGGE